MPAPTREAAFLALPPNDIPALVRFYEQYGVDADEAASMLWMVDDRAELERLMASWDIADRGETPRPPRATASAPTTTP
jgi:hypothetical protein